MMTKLAHYGRMSMEDLAEDRKFNEIVESSIFRGNTLKFVVR